MYTPKRLVIYSARSFDWRPSIFIWWWYYGSYVGGEDVATKRACYIATNSARFTVVTMDKVRPWSVEIRGVGTWGSTRCSGLQLDALDRQLGVRARSGSSIQAILGIGTTFSLYAVDFFTPECIITSYLPICGEDCVVTVIMVPTAYATKMTLQVFGRSRDANYVPTLHSKKKTRATFVHWNHIHIEAW